MSSSPQRSHPLLRVLNHTEATEVECLLHSAAFGKKDRNIFFSNVVSRDGTPVLDNNGDVYQQLHTDYSLGSADPPDSILVLSEYRTAFKDIERWFNGGPGAIPTPIVPDDYIWSRWGDFPPMNDQQSDEKMSESDSSSRDTEQQREGDSSASDLSDNRQAVQIIGIPGTGKSLCLLYILAERLLQGLETCLQTKPDEFTLFCSEGAFKVYIDERFEDVMEGPENADILPMSTWYLVDSNQKIPHPPVEIQCTDARIIQASFPKSSRLNWVKKTGGTRLRYMMKPPTLKEIILMRDCQHTPSMRMISDSMIRDFWDKYGPSARNIFKHSHNPRIYDEELMESIAGIKAETLAALAQKSTTDLEGVSDLIFGVYPGASRSDLVVNISTKYIFQLIKNAQAVMEDDMAMRRMYRLFKQNFQTRAAAGYIFEDHLHELLSKGGIWTANQLVQSGKDVKNFSYTRNADSRAPSQWLCIGQLPYLAGEKPQQAAMPLELCRYSGQNIANTDMRRSSVYYQPDSLTQATYGSHVVNTQEKQVMAFQFTVASKHVAEISGLGWLKQHYGDTGYRVSYVVFADWHPDGDITVYIPRVYDSFLTTKLLVRVTEDELFPREDSTAEKRRASEESDGQVTKKVCVEK